jgi:hypothetical protein
MGGGKKNWITDILVQNLTSEEDWLMDWETGEQSLIDETLASLFAKYEEGDNTLQGGANLLVSDLQSGVLDPYLEKFNLTQEDFLNVIKDYINQNNLYKNNGFGGKKIESVLDLIGDYNLLTAEDRVNDARIEAAREAVGRNKINSLLTSTDPLEEADWR